MLTQELFGEMWVLLPNGELVLGQWRNGQAEPVRYANRSQAERRADKLRARAVPIGIGAGRVKYIKLRLGEGEPYV